MKEIVTSTSDVLMINVFNDLWPKTVISNPKVKLTYKPLEQPGIIVHQY